MTVVQDPQYDFCFDIEPSHRAPIWFRAQEVMQLLSAVVESDAATRIARRLAELKMIGEKAEARVTFVAQAKGASRFALSIRRQSGEIEHP